MPYLCLITPVARQNKVVGCNEVEDTGKISLSYWKQGFGYLWQGVVTYMSPVEAFATGIKMESSNQCSFWELIKGSRWTLSDQYQPINTREALQCFVLWNPEKSSPLEGNDQVIKDDFKIFDPGRKYFYYQYVSDHPLCSFQRKFQIYPPKPAEAHPASERSTYPLQN